MRLGLIARMDRSGLGQGQTLRLYRMLSPDKVMIIDSTPFNGAEQFPQWYKDCAYTTVNGFPNDKQVLDFLKGVDVVLSCETFYHNGLTSLASGQGIKTILIANYEFLDYLNPNYHCKLPDKIVFPSYWHLKDFNTLVGYLPTPIFEEEFKEAREMNLNRTGKRRFLFINGKTAIHDRNGLESLYAALEICRGDFEVVVKAQGEIKKHPDPRITYDFSNPEEQWKLYANYDALILPRRYAGQCLPMCEALQSALPVVMTDIDPNNKVLPKEWLVPAVKTGEFMTRTMIDIYTAKPRDLAHTLGTLDVSREAKEKAYEIGKQYDAERLRQKYEELLR